MANYQINRPKFNWDTKKKLTELREFQDRCDNTF